MVHSISRNDHLFLITNTKPMCCHCYQAISNGIAAKDFIAPAVGLLGTIVVVFMGYYGISVQIHKNRRAKWIEDFRKEVTQFLKIAAELNYEFTPQKLHELAGVITSLFLYLDPENN